MKTTKTAAPVQSRPKRAKAPGKPSGPTAPDLARAQRLLDLLEDPNFLKESREIMAVPIRRGLNAIDNIGDVDAWDRWWPEFKDQHLLAFVRKWRAAPMWNWDLTEPETRARRRAAHAIQSGRWGLVPVFPWTPKGEIESRVRQIRRGIGREHRDADWRRGIVVSWLCVNLIPRPAIAASLWKRTRGLRRPTTSQAIARLSPDKEDKLMQRFARQGLSYQKQVRRVYRAARGSEASAVSMVRMAQQRSDKAGRALTEDLLKPQCREPLASILTKAFEVDHRDDPGAPTEVSRLLRDLRLALLPPS